MSLLCSLFMGCHPDFRFPLMLDVNQLAEEERSRDRAQTDLVTVGLKELKPESSETFERINREFQERLVELREDTLRRQRETTHLINETIGRLAGMSTAITSLPDSILARVTPDISEAKLASAEARTTASSARQHVEGLGSGIAVLRRELHQLGTSTKEELAEVSGNLIDRLRDLEDAKTEIYESLKGELRMTSQQLEHLEGLTVEQLLALLGTGLAAASAGLAGARTGKSRSQAEINELWDKVENLALDIAKSKTTR